MFKATRITLLFFLLLTLATPVFAQDAEYRVQTRRDFGYGNGSDVRGNFSLTIYGNLENVQSVTYLLDGKEMAAVAAPPFKFSFKTSSYPDGLHAISALVNTKDGRQVAAPAVHLNFLSAEQQGQSFQKILIPLVGVLLLIMLGSVGIQFLFLRRGGGHLTPGAERHYGLKGGAICPRCGRAFAIHFWSINLIGGVFDRCDYCGKWAFVRARSRADLDAAVQAEIAAAQASESAIPAVEAESEEERLRKMLDESKYSE
jgi:hypothetical protein